MTVITLISENSASQTPSQADLMQWANSFGIEHPVVADAGFAETANYLWADPSFDGMIYLPNMQLLSEGMVVEMSNTWVLESDVLTHLP